MQIAIAPPGTQAATLDVEAAFRTIPVLPAHKAYTVVSHFDAFWLDHNCPFGAASSGGNHGEVADATVDIWNAMGVGPVVKWVDDFTIFRYAVSAGSGLLSGSFCYNYGLTDIKEMIAPLRVPWHTSKGQDFDFTFTYVGFRWDIEKREVYLTDEKRQKFKDRVDDFLLRYNSIRAPLHAALTLGGSLSHIAFVYPHGRSYLSNIYTWISLFSSEFREASRYLSRSVTTDLRWWSKTLEDSSWRRSLSPKGDTLDLGIWVDASTDWGIGLIWGNGSGWDAWKLCGNWRSPARHIGWLEALAVEFAIRTLDRRNIHDVNVLIRSDNQGVIGAWEKGRGRNFEVNLSIRRAQVIALERNLSFSFTFIESSENLADPISRGELGLQKNKLENTFPLPDELAEFITHV